MKSKDEIEALFKSLEGRWDTEEPDTGHRERFSKKLREGTTTVKKSNVPFWKFISIAATFALLVTIGLQLYQDNPTNTQQSDEILEVTSKKPTNVERTKFYFSSRIVKEIEKIDAISSPQTKLLVDDFKSQLTRLENDYKKLELELQNQGSTKQILNAMIINFQTRINLAQDVLHKIKEIEQLKNTKHEKHTI